MPTERRAKLPTALGGWLGPHQAPISRLRTAGYDPVVRGLVVLAAMSAVLSGCGGDEPETSATTVAGAVTEATAATPDAGDATATTRAGNGGNAGPAAVQTCWLITPVEASEIVGTDVGEGQTLPFETGTACIYPGRRRRVGDARHGAGGRRPGPRAPIAVPGPWGTGGVPVG